MNKFKTFFKKFAFVFVILVFCVTPIFTGCDFSIRSSGQLKTPSISIIETNKSIVWDKVVGAENYEIYQNDVKIDTIESEDTTRIVYDFSAHLNESGDYVYYIVATTSSVYKTNSEKSNKCTYAYTKASIIQIDTPNLVIDDENLIAFVVSGETINYLPFKDKIVDGYKLYLYSQSSGLKTYELESTSVNLVNAGYVTFGEVYAIRLGYYNVVDGEKKEVISSEIKYYNNIPTQYEGYTDKFYIFDGQINDFYIQNQQELNNIVYYSFINRIESFNIRISEDFKSAIEKTYGCSTTVDNVNYAVYNGFNSFYETICYQTDNINSGYASQNGGYFEYKIKVSYFGINECNTSIYPNKSQLYEQSRSTGYWETVNCTMLGEKYGSSYDNFESDKQFLYTEVYTSEQLYWAVENKVTPVFTNTSSRAYIIYEHAKSVLREIISDEMTDYEKALSIFDWIAINTQYDYTNYKNYTGNLSNYPTKLPCYYLEGVFLTGYSVCDGFSKSYSLLCNMLGIDCIRIVGDAKSGDSTGGHAWNKVYIDKNPNDDELGKYYLVDITWTEIVTSDSEEELSHTYFGLSDEDVSETHFPCSARKNKYLKYSSEENLYYYAFQTFEYNDTDMSLVISNEQQLKDMFDYFLKSGRDTLEIVVDYDYMVSVYNANNSVAYKTDTKIVREYYDKNSTLLKSQYDPATDTLIYYNYNQVGATYMYSSSSVINNYKLRTVFQEKAMKVCKFQEQYIFITDENSLRQYDAENLGMLFVFTQNLLIDNSEEFTSVGSDNYVINKSGETAHIVNYFSENEIVGEYYLYIELPILFCAEGESYVEKIESMFANFTSTSNVNFVFELVDDDVVSDKNTQQIVFKMTTTKKN